MFDGAIDNLATSDIYLKLIKRLKEIKDNDWVIFFICCLKKSYVIKYY